MRIYPRYPQHADNINEMRTISTERVDPRMWIISKKCGEYPQSEQNSVMTWSIPRFTLRSYSLVCIENHLFIVGIGPILNK